MKKLLSEIKRVVDDTKPVADKLSSEKIAAFEEDYKDILEGGFAENPLNPPHEPGG